MSDKNEILPLPESTSITFEKNQFERMLRAMRLDGPQMKKIIEAAKPDDEHQKAMLKVLKELALAVKKPTPVPELPMTEPEIDDKKLMDALGVNPQKKAKIRGNSSPA